MAGSYGTDSPENELYARHRQHLDHHRRQEARHPVEEQTLAPELQQLSIRHLALATGRVVFGCQHRGPEANAPPLLGFHRRGETAGHSCRPWSDATGASQLYRLGLGDTGSGIVAASAPKCGLITYWDIGTRQFLGSCELNDGCGIAPTRHKASFLLTSGQGWLGRNRR